MFRPMRRFKQQLSREECAELLQSEPRGVLAVLGDEDYPYAVPLDFVYHEGSLYFHGAGDGHKLDALRRHDKASFCVMDQGRREKGDWALYIRSVIAFGRLRVVEDPGRAMDLVRLLALKYYPTAQEAEREVQKDGPRATILELKIEHLTGKLVHEK